MKYRSGACWEVLWHDWVNYQSLIRFVKKGKRENDPLFSSYKTKLHRIIINVWLSILYIGLFQHCSLLLKHARWLGLKKLHQRLFIYAVRSNVDLLLLLLLFRRVFFLFFPLFFSIKLVKKKTENNKQTWTSKQASKTVISFGWFDKWSADWMMSCYIFGRRDEKPEIRSWAVFRDFFLACKIGGRFDFDGSYPTCIFFFFSGDQHTRISLQDITTAKWWRRRTEKKDCTLIGPT